MAIIDKILDLYNFKRRKWFYLIFATIYIVVIAIYLFRFKELSKTDSKLETGKVEFFTLTDKLLDRNDSTTISINTIKHSFNSVDRNNNGTLSEYGFVSTLEDYLVHILSKEDKFEKAKYSRITDIIKTELTLEPFTQLQPDQRRVLKNLENSINKNDSITALYNLAEVNDIMRNLNIQNEKLENQNEWSIPLAILGLIITILFGIMSVVRPISYVKLKEIIKTSITEKNNVA